MRTFLEDETHPVPARRRKYVPALVAAAVAAIAIGGYVAATQFGGDDGDGSGTEQQPAGQPNGDLNLDPRPKDAEGSGPGESARGDTAQNQLTDGSGPADAGQRCLDAIEQEYQRRGETPPSPTPEVRLVNETTESTTVVASNGESAWACNVDPDLAVSYEVPDAAPRPSAKAFTFAANDTRNYGLGIGTLAWAGGPVPEGVDSIRYVFADGGAAEALVQDGYWAMQYLTDRRADPAPHRGWVKVLLDGPGGEHTVKIHVGVGAFPTSPCGQVSHGC